MNNKSIDVQFYKKSLRDAENEIKLVHESGKALKDIVGKAYETHRKRLWNYFGFDVSKHRYEALFDIDWSITYKGKLIAFEEDKGHYVDSCFLERALSGFCKTINRYQTNGKNVPILILHSFTRYNKFNQKLKEDINTRKPAIKKEILKKLIYTTLVKYDRLKRNKWFSKDFYECYSINANDELIMKDIEFIKSLIPVSE